MDTETARQGLESEERRLQSLRSEVRTAGGLDGGDQDRSGSEISVADQHPGDAGTETQQREMDLSMVEQIESELADVEQAMARLDDGTYGTCEVCREPIEDERLEAMPATRRCKNDAS